MVDRRVRTALAFAARLLVVVLLYLAIGRSIEFSDMTAALTANVAYALAGAVLLTLLQSALCTGRWRRIAHPLPAVPGFRASFFAYVEGLFVNQALPSVVGGDAVRVLRWRQSGVPVADAVISVLLDRTYGLFGAACLALVAALALRQFEYPRYAMPIAAVMSAGILVTCGFVFWLTARRAVPGWLAGLGRPAAIARGFLRFRTSVANSLVCIAYSLLGQVLSGIGVLALARSMGIEVSATILVSVTALIVLVSMIPISLAGWGVREAGFLAILAPLGVAPERAVLLGILFGLQGLLAALVGGVSLLLGLASAGRD